MDGKVNKIFIFYEDESNNCHLIIMDRGVGDRGSRTPLKHPKDNYVTYTITYHQPSSK